MAGTIQIPLTTLTIGPHVFGPATIVPGDKQAILTVDRTVTGGLNATPAAHIDLILDFSNDGGTTWPTQVKAGFEGGQLFIPDKVTGNPILRTIADVRLNGLEQVQNWRVRATVTVSGASVAVAGSLAIT